MGYLKTNSTACLKKRPGFSHSLQTKFGPALGSRMKTVIAGFSYWMITVEKTEAAPQIRCAKDAEKGALFLA